MGRRGCESNKLIDAMPTHWTYHPDNVGPEEDLQQGDILSVTPELKAVFEKVHPHFSDSKYLAFLVITQTCDLVRRKGECSTRYINVAVIRSLASVWCRLIDSICDPVRAGVYSDKDRSRIDQLFDRILNQNESKLGLFYLYPDASVQLGEDAVAFLRVSVAFRSEHYATMVKSRSGRLNSEFSNKLGWLVGNLYSRIGTRDWEREELSKIKLGYIGDRGIIKWISEQRLEYLRKNKVDIAGLGDDLLNPTVHAPRSKKEVCIEQVEKVVREVINPGDDALRRVANRLKNDSVFSGTLGK
jgi:hypothetical protein